jgi:hypothetical protein
LLFSPIGRNYRLYPGYAKDPGFVAEPDIQHWIGRKTMVLDNFERTEEPHERSGLDIRGRILSVAPQCNH